MKQRNLKKVLGERVNLFLSIKNYGYSFYKVNWNSILFMPIYKQKPLNYNKLNGCFVAGVPGTRETYVRQLADMSPTLIFHL